MAIEYIFLYWLLINADPKKHIIRVPEQAICETLREKVIADGAPIYTNCFPSTIVTTPEKSAAPGQEMQKE